MIRSDTVLFGRALKAEIAGVAAAIAMGLILGLLCPALEPTSEMIARTEPQLFDLLVAVFSGFHAHEDDQKTEADKSIALIKSELAARQDIFITGVNYDIIGGALHVLIDASGPVLLTQQEISKIEQAVTEQGTTPVKLFVFMHTDVVVSSSGYEPYSSVSKVSSLSQQSFERQAVQKIIEASNQ